MTTDLVPVSDVTAIEQLDAQSREVAVTQMLVESRTWLATAMSTTDPTASADLRVWLATVEQWTRRFNLAKEIQADAQEMLRRSEYGMSRQILDAQERGEIETTEEARRRGGRIRQGQHNGVSDVLKRRPTDFVRRDDWHGGGGGPGIKDVGRDVSPEQFDDAIEQAKDEGNLTRANVVRKVKKIANQGLTTAQKVTRIREMAVAGHSSDQIAKELGHSEKWVRQLAADYRVEIPADRIMRGTRRVDYTRVVNVTVDTLAALVIGLDDDGIDFTKVDPTQADEWATSLKQSLQKLNWLARQIKEMAQHD